MPGLTSPDNLVYPTVGDTALPRTAITQLADSVQTALVGLRTPADRVTNYFDIATNKPLTAKVGDTFRESDGLKRLWSYDGAAWVLEDTGWINLTMAGTWTTAGGATIAQIRRIGSSVYLTGEVWAGAAASQAVLIPVGFRPKSRTTMVVTRASGSTNESQYVLSIPSALDSIWITGTGGAGIPAASPGVPLGALGWALP